MYVCCCNPFSDKAAKQYLEEKEDKATVKEVYRHCSGGAKPQCGSCLPTLKDMVTGHNQNVTVTELKNNLPARTGQPARQGASSKPASKPARTPQFYPAR